MRVSLFYWAVLLIYGCAVVYLLLEFRSVPHEDRKDLQTWPLLAGVTTLCLVLIWKAQLMADCFAV